MLDLPDIQGLIVRGYTLGFSRYFFLRAREPQAARRWLRDILGEITTAAPWAQKPASCLNVGFSHTGLEALGLPDDSLHSFPQEFRAGMAARAQVLGDTGPSSPAHWDGRLGTPGVHVMLLLFAQDAATLAAQSARHRARFRASGGMEELSAQDGVALADMKEHFGFRDGISQPAIEGSGVAAPPDREPPLKAGEFLLGHPDESGFTPPFPRPDALGRNGSYLVYRKLHEHVAAFRQFLQAQEPDDPDARELLAAKLMGRWPSGAPLVLSHEKDDPTLAADNTFNYAGMDPRGFKCPIGSHLRRVNPRDSLAGERRHRLVRRGLPYGTPLAEGAPDDGADRGLLGILINASIERQFEFVQRNWINAPRFMNLENDKDPFACDSDGTFGMTIQRRPFSRRIEGLPRFVTLRGGGYFFLPSVTALRFLAGT